MAALVQREVATAGSAIEGRNADEILTCLNLDAGRSAYSTSSLRSGPYGDGFGAQRIGLSLGFLEDAPHGVDLGPLQPRIPEVLRMSSGKFEPAPPLIMQDVERLLASLEGLNKRVGRCS